MGSLDKIKGEQKDIDNFKSKYPGSYVMSDKLDGNSGLLQILKGTVKLYSRGDGTIGQNLSNVLPHIKGDSVYHSTSPALPSVT
jgi:NAD-dependent DNA ligase